MGVKQTIVDTEKNKVNYKLKYSSINNMKRHGMRKLFKNLLCFASFTVFFVGIGYVTILEQLSWNLCGLQFFNSG